MKSIITIAVLAIISASVHATPAQYNIQDLGTNQSNFSGIALNSSAHVIGTHGDGKTAKPVAYRNGLIDLAGLFQASKTGDPATLWALNDQDNLLGGTVGNAKFINTTSGQSFNFPENVVNLTALNNQNAVIGSQKDQNGQIISFYFDGTYHSVTANAKINAMNDAGQLAGKANRHAVFLQNYAAALVDLGTLGGKESSAFALNSKGHITGKAEHDDQSATAFYYDGKSLQDIGSLDGDASVGLAINNADIIVGSASVAEDTDHAIYYDGKLYDLNDYVINQNWTLTVAKDINDHNQILAEGYDSQGIQHILLLTPEYEIGQMSANQLPRTSACKVSKKADLAVSIKSSASKVVAGEVLQAGITLSNVGNIQTTQNKVTVALDSNSALVSYSTDSGTCTQIGSNLGCSFAILSTGAKKTIAISLRAKLAGAMTTSVKVVSQETDVNPSDNTAKLLTTITSSTVQPITPPPPSPTLTLTPSIQVVTTSPTWYKPAVGATWQWQLTGTINQNYAVTLYDIDLFDTPTTVINSLKNSGKKVICYFSAGSSENWRSDFSKFKPSDMGAALDGWAGERWLDIRSANVFNVMLARLDLAQSKGCDGVEPDNVDGYTNKNGFSLTAGDQLTYNKKLAAAAHERGLAIALKNDIDQVSQLVDFFDFSINEQCFEYNECDVLKTFVAQGKPVLNAEYNNKYVLNATNRQTLCSASLAAQFSTLVLPLDLNDKFRFSCR